MPRQTLKQRPDGRYVCKYKDRSFYGYTQSEALAAREQYKRMVDQGIRSNAMGETVSSYASRWLPVHKVGIRKGTYTAYAHYMDVLCSVAGDRLVRDITPTDIKAVYGRYIGMSDSTIKKAASLYKALFDTAVADGLCRVNPCKSDRAKPHKGTKGTHRAITDEERQLIHQVKHSFRPAVMVMLYAGLRRGEVLALKTDDIQDGFICVSQAVSFISNQPIIDTPKTDAGIRRVPMFHRLEDELRGVSGLIAPAKLTGNVMSGTSFTRAWESYVLAVECQINGVKQKRWYGLTKEDQKRTPEKYAAIMRLKAQGKEEEADALRLSDWKRFTVRPHDLRHSFCTMLRDAGVDMKLAIRWMGHADEKMILKIYDHITPEREQKAILFVENELARGQNGGQNRGANAQTL